MKIYIGADHRGYAMKNELKNYLQAKEGYQVLDLGAFNGDSVDFTDIAREVAEKVQENPGSSGILLCGSGVGVCMAANKLRGVRAALVHNVNLAQTARQHDWANVLCMGAEVVDTELAKQIVDTFLATEYTPGEDGRYKRRAEKLDQMI